MPWDATTGEERINPQGYGRKPQPRPGYGGVFKGPMPAAPSAPPPGRPAYQRPGGGLFGLGQVGGGAPPMPRSVPSGTPLPMPGPNPPGRQATPDELAAFKAAGGGMPVPSSGSATPYMPQARTTTGGLEGLLGGGMARPGAPDPREALLRQLLLG